MTSDVSSELPVFPMPRACPYAPPAAYEDFRAEGKVARVLDREGKPGWLTTDHEVARQMLGHSAASKNILRPGFPALFMAQPQLAKETKGFLIWMDPPEHTLYRHMLAGEFTVRRVKQMRPHIQALADECVDRLLDGPRPADLVHGFALPYTSLMISELLGVPYADRELFQRCTTAILSHESSEQDRKDAFGEVRALLGGIVELREKEPADDLISTMIRKYREADVYDRDHLVGMSVMLLGAGHETTANMVALGVMTLLDHPEQLAEVTADPELAPKAVEELLRYLSIGDQVTCRVATEDIEIAGALIKEGEGLISPNAAANRDPAVFADPETFDIHRNARPHLAFGYGIHQCLGQHLARTELEIAYTTLFRRLPGLRLDVPAQQLEFKANALFYGLLELPVTW
ncbi:MULTISPECIES: cytochrome P450 [unclassified Streptomyces]|uniref:cytochrome P450 n=1 Tax=unclassified Streptomyces TaxID=2593676 RepID=UPI002E295A1D|nr:cytochrome P450 [Streptomyces sp. NBC_00223]